MTSRSMPADVPTTGRYCGSTSWFRGDGIATGIRSWDHPGGPAVPQWTMSARPSPFTSPASRPVLESGELGTGRTGVVPNRSVVRGYVKAFAFSPYEPSVCSTRTVTGPGCGAEGGCANVSVSAST